MRFMAWNGRRGRANYRKKLSPVVETKEGPVQGFISDGVTEFLGIPYAEPPP